MNKLRPSIIFFDLDWTLIGFPTASHNYNMIENSAALLDKEFEHPFFLSKLFFSYVLLAARKKVVAERASNTVYKSNVFCNVSDCILTHVFHEIMKAPSLQKYEGTAYEKINNAYLGFYKYFMPKICETVYPYNHMVNFVRDCIKENIKIALVTNPLSMEQGIKLRLERTGLQITDFQFITAAENMCYLKPSENYYRSVLELSGFPASKTLMIGNDRKQDGAAQNLGIETIIINPRKADYLYAEMLRNIIF